MGTMTLTVLLTATLGGGLVARLPVAYCRPLTPGLTAGDDAALEADTQEAP